MARNQTAQPTYDFLAGGDPSPPRPPRQTQRETFKQSTAANADIHNENLRTQLHTLQYELDSIKQERELATLEHQQELRDAQNRAEADYNRAHAAETARDAAVKKADQLSRERQSVEDRGANEKLALEKKLRNLQDENGRLTDDLEDAQAELSSQERQNKHALAELEQKHSTLQTSVEGVQQDLVSKVNALQSAQQKLAQRETEVGELENEVLRLKAQTGDSETLSVIKNELSEQVAYIKKLESTNREQLADIKQFRKSQKNVDVVEEEKHALEAKLRIMDDLRRELSEAQLQKRILEDEKRGWTSYLESEAASQGDLNYETPEQMAKAFLQERLERLSLVDKLGSVQPELSSKDEEVQTLLDERAKLQTEMEKLRSSNTGAAPANASDAKLRMRAERQKTLMSKELEYLRAQMKTFEAEEAEFNPEQVDEERLKRVHELEDMVEQYRTEVQNLQTSLSQAELQHPLPQSSQKRVRESSEEPDERLGELRRKMRSAQSELEQLQTRNAVLEAELQASLSQVTILKESARTRVLEFRDNPTAKAEAIKMSTLRTLREENAALLAQLEDRPNGTKVVPVSTLENMRLQQEDMQDSIKQTEKKTLRLKQIWSSKSLEFREAVCSILGWKLDFMPNGRVKASSILYPSLVNSEGEEEENSIVFDGENGTMKVSGGPRSLFAGEIKGLIEFWVEGRKEIPCFLAACTLEFYEKTTRAVAA